MNAADAFAKTMDSLKILAEFDARIFSDLKDDTDPVVALKILARFSITLSEGTAAITHGLQALNGDAIWKALHKTSGSAELVGFRQFGLTSRELLNKVKANPGKINTEELQQYLQRSQKLLADINAAFANLKDYL